MMSYGERSLDASGFDSRSVTTRHKEPPSGTAGTHLRRRPDPAAEHRGGLPRRPSSRGHAGLQQAVPHALPGRAGRSPLQLTGDEQRVDVSVSAWPRQHRRGLYPAGARRRRRRPSASTTAWAAPSTLGGLDGRRRAVLSGKGSASRSSPADDNTTVGDDDAFMAPA